MKVSPAGYAHLINALSCLSNGKLCVLLEGGYCIKSLSECVALSVRALLGYPTPRVEEYIKPDPKYYLKLENNFQLILNKFLNQIKLRENFDECNGCTPSLLEMSSKFKR